MDNLCHTLVGAALAKTGLERRTPLAAATLMIGANFPDIDVLAVPLGTSLTFRRGVTHGIPALIVLPFVLTGLMLLWDRWRRRSHTDRPPPVARELLLLSAISILTHPTLDFLNSYGMRWLMPISGRWFYGDSLFIIDLWLWLLLGAAWLVGRRRVTAGHANPWMVPRLLVAVAAAYITAMVAGSVWLRPRVAQWVDLPIDAPSTALMVSAVPVNPLEREVIWKQGDRYRFGRASVADGGRVREDVKPEIPIGGDDPAVRAARMLGPMRDFLSWSRFPFYTVERRPTGTAVTAADARYSDRAAKGWASVTVMLPDTVIGRLTGGAP